MEMEMEMIEGVREREINDARGTGIFYGGFVFGTLNKLSSF
jgi:hypothetical protein